MISTQEELLSGCPGDKTQDGLLSMSKGTSDFSLPFDYNHGQRVDPSSHHLHHQPTILAESSCAGFVDVSSSEDTLAVSLSESFSIASQKEKEEVVALRPSEGGEYSQPPTKMEPERPHQDGRQLCLKKKKREEQLRLLNKKISQRHSKLPHESEPATKAKKTSQKGASLKARQANAKARSSTKDKGGLAGKTRETSKVASRVVSSSKSAPSLRKSKKPTASTVPQSNSRDTVSTPSHTSTSGTIYTPPPSRRVAKKQLTTSPQPHHQAVTPQLPTSQDTSMPLSSPSVHLTSSPPGGLDLDTASSSMMVTIEDDDTISANDSGLLDSTSCLLDSASCLIPDDGDGNETLVASTDIGEDGLTLALDGRQEKVDLPDDMDSLASSLTRAYGLTMNSQFLSTLSSPQVKGVEMDTRTSKATGELADSQKTAAHVENSSETGMSTMLAHKAATMIQTAW